MYAVIETGGKQYRVEVGTVLEVELLDVEPGQSITLDRVLLVADGTESAVGTPIVDGAAVEAEVVGATRGDKVIAFKYQPKARRRVKKGHRQNLTVLRISDIRLGGKSAAKDEAKAAPSKADEKKRLEEAAARQAAEDAALAAKLKVAAPVEAEAAPEAAPEAEAAPAPKKSRAKAAAAPAEAPVDEPEAVEPAEPAAAEAKNTKAFEIHEDKAGKWRWRLRARNGELVAMSDQGFASKAGVVKALDVVRRNVAEAEGHEEAPTGDDAAMPGTSRASRSTRTSPATGAGACGPATASSSRSPSRGSRARQASSRRSTSCGATSPTPKVMSSPRPRKTAPQRRRPSARAPRRTTKRWPTRRQAAASRTAATPPASGSA